MLKKKEGKEIMRTCVSAIIINENGEVLLQKHNKVQAWTFPGGKVNFDELYSFALAREAKEELDITVNDYELNNIIDFKNKEYPVGSGKFSDFSQRYYKILSYSGTIKNMEPEKHPELKWVYMKDIRNTVAPISTVLDTYLQWNNM